MAYVFSCCEGPAARQLAPRMRPDASLCYKDATDMITYPGTIYEPCRTTDVNCQYQDLSTEYHGKFSEIFPFYSLYAEKAEILES